MEVLCTNSEPVFVVGVSPELGNSGSYVCPWMTRSPLSFMYADSVVWTEG